MKRRRFEKKLGLKKITVANLSFSQMKEILGGEPVCTANCTHDCTVFDDVCELPETTYSEPGTTHPL